MNEKVVAVEKLEEESLNSVVGGEGFQTFNQVAHVAGLSTMVVGGLSSIGLLTASFVCDYKGVDYKKCLLLKKLAFSTAAVSGLGMLTSACSLPGTKEED